MAGLRKMCRDFGHMTIDGVKWVWDYAADEPVLAKDMPLGSERWKRSERARWAAPDPKEPDHDR